MEIHFLNFLKPLYMKSIIFSRHILVSFFSSLVLLSLNAQTLDTLAIQSNTGIKGKFSNGEYKITIPQNDLNVEVDGFKIIPPMGLGTWIAFTPTKEGAMIMGDIV